MKNNYSLYLYLKLYTYLNLNNHKDVKKEFRKFHLFL